MVTLLFLPIAGLLALALASLSGRVAGAGGDPTPAPEGYTNPVLNHDFPDPDVLRVGDVFFAYATNSGGVNIQVARSTDLVRWEMLPDALPRLPSWAAQEFGFAWAPEVTTFDGEQFVLYHVARYLGVQCIGVAVSPSPEGPFEPVSEAPLVCQTAQGGSIDPATFVDDDGTPYLLWKNDGNALGGKTWIYIQPLAPDGLRLLGEPVPLLERDQRWEGRLIEAPTLWKRDGRYYLFYSANDYASPSYAVGYAVAGSILGPYTKPGREPLLKSNLREGVVGPGGQDLIRLADGSEWMFYHGWVADGRALFLSRMLWHDGVPSVLAQRGPQPAPLERDTNG